MKAATPARFAAVSSARRGARFPYKAVLTHAGQADSARAFDSIREAEAFIRRNTPAPAPRSTLYNRTAGDS